MEHNPILLSTVFCGPSGISFLIVPDFEVILAQIFFRCVNFYSLSNSFLLQIFNGLNWGRRGLGLSQHTSTPSTELRLNRKQIRYLPMSGKPSKYKNVNLNKSLSNLTSIYCDPSDFSGSTLSLPTTSFTDLAHKDSTSQRLTKMCQGFVNYDLTLSFLTFDDVTKPLDEGAFISVGKVLLNAEADKVATCLATETASILTLNWLSNPEDGISPPSDGYSLLLWPAANGYRRDLFNR